MTTQHDEHESIDSVELDILGEPVIMPAHKLDADQYSADDIDGVTESIFGSGNLAYASLQASQTDAAIALNEAMAQDQDHAPEHDDGGSSGGVPVGFADNVSSFAPQPGAVHVIPTDTDRVLDAGNEIRAENPGTEGHFSGGTVGALGASALSFDAGSFSGGSGEGDRPLVVSYATSPVAEVVFASPQPAEAPTGVMTDGCFRQVEFAGVLVGAQQPELAKRFVDYMLAAGFQTDIPFNMFVFPAVPNTYLEPEFTDFAANVPNPLTMAPGQIGANRERWLNEWQAATH